MSNERPLAVRCRDLVKNYGTGAARVSALRGVDLDVYGGELLMLVGPSGCGKTTLISILSAMLEQDEGRCEVLGHDLLTLDKEAKASFRCESVGFVFQLFNLLPALSALENVAIPLLVGGVSYQAAISSAQAALDSVGLADRADALPGKLSGGQQQRVAIARALVHNPKLILCDEPTSSLDHKTGYEMMKVLRGIANNPDRTLIVVTHDNRILDFADRIAMMDDGRIVNIETKQNSRGQI